jgi:hypothetical protein
MYIFIYIQIYCINQYNEYVFSLNILVIVAVVYLESICKPLSFVKTEA